MRLILFVPISLALMLLSCFTGIAYSDICRLRKDQIISDPDKGMYIHLYRTKTNHPAFIPLLPQARKMVSLYIGKGESEYLFPTISNQKSNAYLKELADICHIRKRVTFHVARHINSSYPLKTKNLQRLSA
ncbi:hypothetical protein B5F34_13435 [Mediterranea sp. An20]|nr:hypothetical protein B5F34_13435 [Mediterranea sp. An20]